MESIAWHQPLCVIDSHTGGEPTRVVVNSGLELQGLSPAAARKFLATHHDLFRRAVINEPRGNDVLVGALVLPPTMPDTLCGVVFFNNVGYLGMCGHGLIGLAATLHHQGSMGLGKHRIETPVGVVEANLLSPNRVQVTNVPSYRWKTAVPVQVGAKLVHGDIAWGGNWFYLVQDHSESLTLNRWRELTQFTQEIRQALVQQNIRGADGEEIDHVELFSPGSPGTDSRNFVLCPGLAYDRSPCGTGSSAKVACLAAAGKLRPGQTWKQESITGSCFDLEYQSGPALQIQQQAVETVVPSITGNAYVCAETQLHFHPEDPFRSGIIS